MKKTFIFATATTMLLCSFSTKHFNSTSTSATTMPAETTTVTDSTVVSNANGRAAGMALKALYDQYKIDGKYDYSNLTNILNTISLLDNCKQLKSNAKNSEYWKEFASGLILGSDKLITEELATGVTEKLNDVVENLDTTKLEKAKNNATTAANAVATCASSVSDILSLFKK